MACLKLAIILICVADIYGKCVLEPGSKTNKGEQKLLDKVNSMSGTRLTVKDENHFTYNLFVCGNNRNVTAEQDTNGEKFILGLANRTAITAGHNWLMTTHYGGSLYKKNGTCKGKRMIHFMFVCDSLKSEAEAQFIDERKNENGCFYMVEVSHSSICTPETGLSGTSIFFLLLFIGFGLYFAFGFLYRRLVIGAKGIEQIPNRLFWCNLGNKLADGCDKVLRCDRWCGRGTSGSSYDGYTPIDEQLAQDLQDTDRDSTLLSP